VTRHKHAHNCCTILFLHVGLRGEPRKLFGWHIGLESPKTTKRDAEGVDGRGLGREFTPSLADYSVWVSVVSSLSGVWGGAPAANNFWALHMQFCAISCMFREFWNLTGKANRTDSIRSLLLATGLAGHVPPCAPSGSAHGRPNTDLQNSSDPHCWYRNMANRV